MKRIFGMVLLCCLMLSGTAFAKQGTLLVAFGTSMPSAKVALDDLEKVYKQAYGKKGPLLMAYTSDIIRNKLAKQGKPVLSVFAAMNALAEKGVTELTIQSFHVVPAQEYSQLERIVIKNLTKFPNRFTSVKVGNPLLVSKQDLDEVIAAVLASLPKDRKANEAVVLMGHGNNHGPGDLILLATANAFQEADSKVWLATVEGAVSFDKVLPALKAAKVERVWLLPFMVVAGDHANNDLAGPDADSWASQIQAAGMQARPHLVGLGQVKDIQNIFLRHTKDAITDLANTQKAD